MKRYVKPGRPNNFRRALRETTAQRRYKRERNAGLCLLALVAMGFAFMFYGAYYHDCRHGVPYTGCTATAHNR